MSRTSFVLTITVPLALSVPLVFTAASCLQDFNQFQPGDGGSTSTTTSSSPTTTTMSTSTSTSVSTSVSTTSSGMCTEQDLTNCETTNICSPASCPAGTCVNTPVPDDIAPGYLDDPTDCVEDRCVGGVLMTGVPDDTEMHDDDNECTFNQCSGGSPSNPPDPAQDGMMCGGTLSPDITCDNGVCHGCGSPGDCPQGDADCQQATCSGTGICGLDPKNEGMNTASGQVAGDCKKRVCVAGVPTQQNDDDPMNDGNVCTNDTCVGGVNHHDPAGNTTNCGTGPTCMSGMQKAQDKCNGTTCMAGATMACTPFACGATACDTTCSALGDCATGFDCELDSGTGTKQNHCQPCLDDGDCAVAATPHCEDDPAQGIPLLDTCVECRFGTDADCTGNDKGHTCRTGDTCGCGTAMAASPDCTGSALGTTCLATHLCGP